MTTYVQRIVIDASGARRGAGEAESSMRRIERSGNSTSGAFERLRDQTLGAGSAFDRLRDHATGVSAEFGRLNSLAMATQGALAGLIGVMGVRTIIGYADAWTNASNQIQQVTGSTAELQAVQEQLINVTKDTRANFEATVGLYSRLARSTTELGLSQRELLGITTTINKSFAVSGASANEAASAITQLSQGLAAGALRGEEFNSVAEQAPGIMRAIASSLNMTTGELRDFAADGSITAEIVIDALQGASDAIDNTFGESVASFGQKMEIARTNMMAWVGASDETNGAVDVLGNSIVGLSEHIDDFVNIGEAAAVLLGTRLAIALRDSTTETIGKTAAGISDAKASYAAAQADEIRAREALRVAHSEQSAAQRALENSRATVAATGSTTNRTRALEQLAIANGQVAAAERTLIASTEASAVAMGHASVAARGLAGAMALVGGPFGAAVLAVGAIAMYHDELDAMLEPAQQATQRVDELTNAINMNSEAAINGQLVNLTGQMFELEQQAAQARQALEEINATSNDPGPFRNSVVMGGDAAERREAYESLRDAEEQLEANSEAAALLRKSLEELRDGGTVPLTSSLNNLASTSKEAEKAQREFGSSLRSLLDRIDPLAASQREYTRETALLQTAMLSGRMTIEEYFDALGKLEKSYQNAGSAAEAYGFTGTKAMNDVTAAADPMATAIERSIERMDDAFVDSWRGLLDGSQNAFESFKDIALDALAEVIHAFTTRKITASLGLSIAGTGTAVAGQSGGMGDLASIGHNVYQGVVDGFGNIAWAGNSHMAYGSTGAATGGWANSATSGIGQSGLWGGSTSNFSGMSGLASAGAGFVGSYAGNAVGESLFDKQANSSYGRMAGAAIGTYFGGPIGAGIGAFVGGLVDTAFGSGREYGFRFAQRAIDPSMSGIPIGYDASHGDGTPWYSSGDYANGDLGRGRTTAFGSYGFLSKEVVEPEDMIKFLDAMAQIDNTLAAVMDADQVGRIKEALDGYYYKGDDMQAVMRERLAVIVEQADSAFESAIEKMGGNIEGQVAALANGLQIENVGAEMASAVADDMNAEFREALSSGGDLNAATQAILASAQAVKLLGAGVERLNLQFDAAGDGALVAAEHLNTLAGGLDSLTSLQSAYYQAFFSEQERLSHQALGLVDQFEALNIAVPRTRDAYRDLVEAQNLNTEAGRELYVTLLKLAPATAELMQGVEQAIISAYQSTLDRDPDSAGLAYWMGQVTSGALSLEQAIRLIGESTEATTGVILTEQGILESAREAQEARIDAIEREREALENARETIADFTTGVEDWLAQLRGTDAGMGTPQEQLAATQAAFAKQLVAAENGDRDALGSITEYADRYLEAAKGMFASGTGAQLVLSEVTSALENLPDSLSPEEFLADEFRDALDSQTDSLADAFDTLRSSISRDLDNAWDRIDISGESLIDWSEFRAAFAGVADRETLQRVFEALDNNGTGAIDQLEAISGGTRSLVDYWTAQQSTGVKDAVASITDMYESALGREPDLPGLQYWINEWLAGSSLGDIQSSIDQHVTDKATGGSTTPPASETPTLSPLDEWLQGQSDQRQSWASAIDTMYDSLLDRDPTIDDLKYWLNDLSSGQSLSDVQNSIRAAVDGSHRTGLSSVPYDGYLAELHKGEIVTPAAQAPAVRSFLSGPQDNGVVKAIRELHRLVDQLLRENQELLTQGNRQRAAIGQNAGSQREAQLREQQATNRLNRTHKRGALV